MALLPVLQNCVRLEAFWIFVRNDYLSLFSFHHNEELTRFQISVTNILHVFSSDLIDTYAQPFHYIDRSVLNILQLHARK